MKPRYLIQINLNEDEYIRFLKLMKLANLGKTQLIKTALFAPELIREAQEKIKEREGK